MLKKWYFTVKTIKATQHLELVYMNGRTNFKMYRYKFTTTILITRAHPCVFIKLCSCILSVDQEWKVQIKMVETRMGSQQQAVLTHIHYYLLRGFLFVCLFVCFFCFCVCVCVCVVRMLCMCVCACGGGEWTTTTTTTMQLLVYKLPLFLLMLSHTESNGCCSLTTNGS